MKQREEHEKLALDVQALERETDTNFLVNKLKIELENFKENIDAVENEKLYESRKEAVQNVGSNLMNMAVPGSKAALKIATISYYIMRHSEGAIPTTDHIINGIVEFMGNKVDDQLKTELRDALTNSSNISNEAMDTTENLTVILYEVVIPLLKEFI